MYRTRKSEAGACGCWDPQGEGHDRLMDQDRRRRIRNSVCRVPYSRYPSQTQKDHSPMYICTLVGAVDDPDTFLALLTVYREFRVNSAYNSYLKLCYLFCLIWDAPFRGSRDDCARSQKQYRRRTQFPIEDHKRSLWWMPCFLTVSSNRVLFRWATAMGELSTRASVMLAAAPRVHAPLHPLRKEPNGHFQVRWKEGPNVHR